MIKVGFCVSYDWELLKNSLPKVYSWADIICLAIDKDRRSWGGNQYEFNDEAFYFFIKNIDRENKVIIYEDSFSLPDLNARQNCNRHRMLIAEKLGKGGWHIQVDCDEYFLNFESFVRRLTNINIWPTGNEKPINVCPALIPLIKKTRNGFLYVDFLNSFPEFFPAATSKPQYERARQNGHFNVLVPEFVVHETWARSEDEMWYKINNWGHSAEELEEKKRRLSYYNFWKSLDELNFQYVRNFHPAVPHTWPALGFCKGDTIEEFMQNLQIPKFPLSAFQLKLMNSRNVSRVKSFSRKIIDYVGGKKNA